MKILWGDSKEVTLFGEILSEQTVGVLIQATLPGTVGVSEIDLCAQALLQAEIIKEFVAVIHSKGTQQRLGQSREGSTRSICQRFRLAVRHQRGDQEARSAVYKGRCCPLALCAADGITLPMAVLRAGIGGLGRSWMVLCPCKRPRVSFL